MQHDRRMGIRMSFDKLIVALSSMSTDTEQVPAPDLPYSEDKTDSGLYRNCDFFLFAKRTIRVGDWMTWNYVCVDAKSPAKRPPMLPYCAFPPTKKRNRSLSPVSPRPSPSKKTWAPTFQKHQPLIEAARIQASKNESIRVAKLVLSTHQCSHHTKCPAGKCSLCTCSACAVNNVLAAGKRQPKPANRY